MLCLIVYFFRERNIFKRAFDHTKLSIKIIQSKGVKTHCHKITDVPHL